MNQNTRLNRRQFVGAVGAASLLVAMNASLVGCASGPLVDPSVEVDFAHGVASGDPLSDRVILWTHASASGEGDVPLEWEISRDEMFSELVVTGRCYAQASNGGCVKVDATGLAPGSFYFYRFRFGTQVSPVGRTRTLAEGSIDTAKLAVFSCSNFAAGYFNVYRAAAERYAHLPPARWQQDYDAVLHLGDYIYEYQPGGYPRESLPGRDPVPANELLTLTDYRQRYAQYRSDADLQALHQRYPFICVWDDHEIANDAWRAGAENHNPGEGEFGQRRLAAVQAFYEWLPIRPPAGVDRDHIYRHFQFGDLVDLYMLDTRLIGRDRQLQISDYSSEHAFDDDHFVQALSAPERSLLGPQQRSWLLEHQLPRSQCTWQTLGQQVLMGQRRLPPQFLQAIRTGDTQQGLEILAALRDARQTPFAERTPVQQQLLSYQLPYNPDSWDGYPAEREQLLNAFMAQHSNLVVLTGDTHNAWGYDLVTASGDIAGVEFATTAVTSPGMGDYLGLADQSRILEFEQLWQGALTNLEYFNSSERGFLEVSFSHREARAHWIYVDTVQEQDFSLALQRQHVLRTLAGQPGLVAV